MEINRLFAVFPIPFLTTRDRETSHLWNLPRLQDDQENADSEVFGTASASDKPSWMAGGAILAQVFHPPTPSTQAEEQGIRRSSAQIHRELSSLTVTRGTSTQTLPTQIRIT